MRVLVVGSGGREHALAWSLSRSAGLGELHAAPGNPGIAELAHCHPVRADDQASAATCQQMVAGARGRSARVEIHVYPGAHHDFDHPNRPLQVRTGLAFSVDGSGRVHSGTNAAARADALKRVPEWFER